MAAVMPAAQKMVLKRSTRTFLEDDADLLFSDTLEKRLIEIEDLAPEQRERRRSTSTLSSEMTTTSTQMEHEKVATDLGIDVDKMLGHNLSSPDLAATPPVPGQPPNFGVVVPGVYRSSYPQMEDHAFIRSLGLKTVVTLVNKDFPEGYKNFLKDNGIDHHIFNMKGTKKEEIPAATMKSILRVVLHNENYPLLIHCNHGKHRTGCVVGIVRKVTGWDLGQIISEYKSYAEPKVRDCDIQYISGFKLSSLAVQDSRWIFRTRSFMRATILSFFVLALWVWSGKRIIMQATAIL